MGYSPSGYKELDTTEWLILFSPHVKEMTKFQSA